MPLFQKFSGFDPASLAVSGIGGLLSLFGGGGQLTPEQQRLLRLQTNVANQLYASGTGIPGSSPQERAALAELQGQLGAQQLSQQNNALAALSRNASPGQTADFYQNQISLQTAQRQALESQQMLANMAQRRNDLLQAAGVAQGAAGLASQPGQPNPLANLSGLAQQVGYQHGYGQPGPVGQPASGNQQKTGLDLLTQGKMGQDANQTLGAAIQAQQGAQGLGQPANVLGGYTSMLNQYRQAGGLTSPAAQQFQNPWLKDLFPGGLRLPNGVSY